MTKTQEPETQDVGVPQKRGVKAVKHSARLLWLLFSLPLVILLVVVALLIDRDVKAPTWVKDRVQERAALILAGGQVSFGEITVNLGRDLHPRITLRDSTLRDADGAVLARIDEIAGLVSPRGLLFERAALLQEVDLRGVALTIARAADGSVALSFQGNRAALDGAPSITGLIAQSEAVFDRPALQAMEQVRVADLSVTYTDARADQTWRVDAGRAALDLRDARTLITASLPLHAAATQTDIALAFESPHQSPAADLRITIDNIAANDLALQSPALAWLTALDAPLSAQITSSLDDAGVQQPLVTRLDIGAGTLRPNGSATPIAFERAGVSLAYDPSDGIVRLTGLDIESDLGALRGTGQAIIEPVAVGLPRRFLGQLALVDIKLDPPGLFAAPVDIAQADVDVRLSLDPFQIEVGQAVITDPKLSLLAKGAVAAGPAGWDAQLDVRQIGPVDIATVLALWPETVKPRSRKWVSENVVSGVQTGGTFDLRLRPNRPPRFAVGFGYQQARVTFLRSMPPVQDASGYVSIANDRLAVTIDAGHVAAPLGGNVDIAGSSVVIADLRKPVDNRMQVNLESRSAITAALALLDQEPMRVMAKAGRPVTLADGRATLSGQISFPLGRRPQPGELLFDFTGNLSRVNSTQLVPGRRLAGTGLQIDVTETSLALSGDVTLDSVPLRGSYKMGIGAASNGRAQVDATVTITPQTLEIFDVSLPPGTVAGRGIGTLRLDLARDQPTAFELSSNLRGITLALPAIGWSKGANAQGRLQVAGTLGVQPAIRVLEVGGGGLTARGAISFDANGGLNVARFDTVRLNDWLNAPITLRGRGRGRPVAVEIAGGALDLRRARFGGGSGDGGPVVIALDRLQITEGIALDGFRGSFDGAGGFSGQFEGRVNGGPLVQGTVAPRNGRSAVRLVTEDAGGVLRAAGVMRNAIGGTLDLTLLPAGGAGTFDGTLAARGVRVRDAPAMAALLDAISVVGLLQQLDGQGLSFETVDARFRLTPNQVIVTRSSATGPGLGISLDGTYRLADKGLDFQGVVSPFYLLNQIGSVLTRPGEGLIGFNFNITGTAANPAVAVNPLSVLTPGMFRDIFRRAPPEVSP